MLSAVYVCPWAAAAMKTNMLAVIHQCKLQQYSQTRQRGQPQGHGRLRQQRLLGGGPPHLRLSLDDSVSSAAACSRCHNNSSHGAPIPLRGQPRELTWTQCRDIVGSLKSGEAAPSAAAVLHAFENACPDVGTKSLLQLGPTLARSPVSPPAFPVPLGRVPPAEAQALLEYLRSLRDVMELAAKSLQLGKKNLLRQNSGFTASVIKGTRHAELVIIVDNALKDASLRPEALRKIQASVRALGADLATVSKWAAGGTMATFVPDMEVAYTDEGAIAEVTPHVGQTSLLFMSLLRRRGGGGGTRVSDDSDDTRKVLLYNDVTRGAGNFGQTHLGMALDTREPVIVKAIELLPKPMERMWWAGVLKGLPQPRGRSHGSGWSFLDHHAWFTLAHIRNEILALHAMQRLEGFVLRVNTAENGRLYIAMKLMPGKNMVEALSAEAVPMVAEDADDSRPLSSADQLQLQQQGANILAACAEVCRDLDRLHRVGFLHRDVKPENIMLDVEGRTGAVIDYGMAAPGFGSTSCSRTIMDLLQEYPSSPHAAADATLGLSPPADDFRGGGKRPPGLGMLRIPSEASTPRERMPTTPPSSPPKPSSPQRPSKAPRPFALQTLETAPSSTQSSPVSVAEHLSEPSVFTKSGLLTSLKALSGSCMPTEPQDPLRLRYTPSHGPQCCTAAYIAPEVLEEESFDRTYTAASDAWSLGQTFSALVAAASKEQWMRPDMFGGFTPAKSPFKTVCAAAKQPFMLETLRSVAARLMRTEPKSRMTLREAARVLDMAAGSK